MDGFKRPIEPRQQKSLDPQAAPTQVQESLSGQEDPQLPLAGQSEIELPAIEEDFVETHSRRKKQPIIIAVSILLLIVVTVCMFFWYQVQLQPVDTANGEVQKIEITEGVSLNYVADRLQERGLIRSSFAFSLLANLQGKQGAMKAGTCNLTPANSSHEILDKIITGCHDFKSVTFYPGATLETSLYAKTKAANEGKEFNDMSIRASLRAAGYSDSDITKAFETNYESPLFAGKPSSEGYEGYIFGETYYVDPSATAEDILKTAFEHMYSIIESEGLVAKFEARGLNLYQGITLASIVGRELDCEGKPTEERKQKCYGYQQQIASVFYNRLASGMSLGSDVTSIYASDKLGSPSSVDSNSPYNTRRHPGLTPGPIATPGKLALLSVANPAEDDNLFFVAGDDGLIYFAKDNAGHEANVANHCKLYCGDL